MLCNVMQFWWPATHQHAGDQIQQGTACQGSAAGHPPQLLGAGRAERAQQGAPQVANGGEAGRNLRQALRMRAGASCRCVSGRGDGVVLGKLLCGTLNGKLGGG